MRMPQALSLTNGEAQMWLDYKVWIDENGDKHDLQYMTAEQLQKALNQLAGSFWTHGDAWYQLLKQELYERKLLDSIHARREDKTEGNP